jgi:Fe-Mn family superoxide dismutase
LFGPKLKDSLSVPFALPPLSYSLEALEPHLSARTLTFHREKHHQGYLDNLNKLLEGGPLAGETLEGVIQKSHKEPSLKAVFNNGAQVWNHSFYWDSLDPKGGGTPQDGPLKRALEKRFGTVEEFKKAFKQAALGQFGSGWAWLVLAPSGDLEITSTANADSPLTGAHKPLLTCDVWEHAYYLDYQNRRVDYVQVFLDHLVNWSFAEQQLQA